MLMTKDPSNLPAERPDDDVGVPVSMETVKSGLPVTVHYTQEGERMVATKVVVRKTMSSTGAPTIEKKTTTTTTSETK